MDVTPGQIVKNLIASAEPIPVNQIQDLSSMISVKFTGVNSNVSSNKIITRDAFEKLEVLTAHDWEKQYLKKLEKSQT